MQNRNITIHDLAAKLNISASTVSRALNDYYRISKETRELVKKTAAEMNYKPNKLATSLRKGKANTIGVIIPRIDRHFFSHAIAGIESVTNPTDYNILICQSNDDYETEKLSMAAFARNQVDGIIISLATGTQNVDHIKSVLKRGVPVVMFDRVSPELDTDNVINDNFAGAYEATKHLLAQGCRNVIHFAGPQHLNVYRERMNGYKKAMEEYGMNISNDMILINTLTREQGFEAAKQLWQNKHLPDGIFSASDFSALGALLFLKEKGIAVPNETAIAGFANEPFTELTEPAITSLEQYGAEIGKSAARLLIDRIESNQQNSVSQTITFRPRLIIRDSSLKQESN